MKMYFFPLPSLLSFPQMLDYTSVSWKGHAGEPDKCFGSFCCISDNSVYLLAAFQYVAPVKFMA